VIEISSIGFISKQVNITTNNQKVNILLQDEQNLLNEIVVSASRTPERVLGQLKEWELQILKVSVSYFYDGLENMKEVQMNTSSLSLSQSPVVLQQWQIRVSCSWLMGWTMLLLY
jgi:hypothetical protein